MAEAFDVVIIGGGAAGLMCAIVAGGRGRRVLVVEHANRVGKKILMSGGGRCNFTNLGTTPAQFLSANPHFCKSALARYSPEDFVAMVRRHGIAFHEKELGQLFCDESSKQIVTLGVQKGPSSVVSVVGAVDGFLVVSPALVVPEDPSVPVPSVSVVAPPPLQPPTTPRSSVIVATNPP